ncbi:MAG: thermonuclease family protein [Cyanobacteria bacterium J06597_1]
MLTRTGLKLVSLTQVLQAITNKDTASSIGMSAGISVGIAAVATFVAPAVQALPTQAIRPPEDSLYPAQVLRVVDGETLLVRFVEDDAEPGGLPFDRVVEVDVAGIDAPLEEQMPWSYYTGQYLQDRVNRRRVLVELIQAPEDTAGSVPAYIWMGDTLVNEEMLNLGHALSEDEPLDARYSGEFLNAQEIAQKQGRGIWNYYSPLPQSPAQLRQSLGD